MERRAVNQLRRYLRGELEYASESEIVYEFSLVYDVPKDVIMNALRHAEELEMEADRQELQHEQY